MEGTGTVENFNIEGPGEENEVEVEGEDDDGLEWIGSKTRTSPKNDLRYKISLKNTVII